MPAAYIPYVVFGAYLLLNAQCFALFAWDKSKAKRKKQRISEKALLISAACFGALGGMLSMYLVRHKTRKWKFVLALPAMLTVQIGLTILVLIKL